MEDVPGYGMVAHGTWQDSWCHPAAWSYGLFPNWRNVLWSCNWSPVSNYHFTRWAVGNFGVPVAISNGWGDDCGASEWKPREKDEILRLFRERLQQKGRVRYLTEDPAVLLARGPHVPAAGDLAISVFLPKRTPGAGTHYAAQQTSYIGPGDLTGATSFPEGATITSWVFLAGVDVLAPESASAVVAFGDSITDGARSTIDANRRWPDFLAARLLARRGGRKIGVLDAGIGGNRILHDASGNVRFGVSALARFDRDVLAQPGVKYVIVLEGINDLGHPGSSAPDSETVTAEDMIAGLKQMIERAHEHGLKIFGATLTPFEGTVFKGYFTPEKEAKRKAVNEWIRTARAFDGVIDFDKAVRDPKNPDRILPAYDGGDRLHPGDAGYGAMGEAIDLSLFK